MAKPVCFAYIYMLCILCFVSFLKCICESVCEYKLKSSYIVFLQGFEINPITYSCLDTPSPKFKLFEKKIVRLFLKYKKCLKQ